VSARKNSPALDLAAPSAIGAIYARYSDHTQKDESIEQQIEACMQFALQSNIEVVETYEDRAVTGRSDIRTAFQRMLRDAEKRKFQYIIAYKSNRISRNMLHALTYEEKLSRFGIRILYAKEEFGDTAAGRFALRTMMNVNQFYSENMSEDIKRGLMDNAAKCMVNGRVPLGYKKGEDGKYAVDDAGAAIVREIFGRVAAGEPYVDIATDLNGRGIPTAWGNKWNKGSFHKLIANDLYIGVYRYSKVVINDGVPPIIEKELFYKVQNKRSSRHPVGRHRANGDYLLTGKLFCGRCQSPMVGVSGTSKTGKLHYYYICQKKRVEKVCDKTTVRREWLEQQVADDTKRYVLRDDVMEWLAEQTVAYQDKLRNSSELRVHEKELLSVKKAIKNILTAIELGIITASTKDRLTELEAEQAKLESSVYAEKIEVPQVTKEQVLFWLESFREGDIENKEYQARLIDAFVTAVYLYDDEIRIVFNYTGRKSGRCTRKLPENADTEGATECSYRVSYSPPRQNPVSARVYSNNDVC
jgi:DNA invertase Pin-like site-specific DNA recombinase